MGWLRGRPECSSGRVIAVLTVYFVIVVNLTLWRYALASLAFDRPGAWLFAASLPLTLALGYGLFFCLAFWPYAGKAVTIPLLVVSAGVDYFTYSLGARIDPDMIRTVLGTNLRETREIVTASGVLWVLALGVLPAAALWRTRVRYAPWRRELVRRAVAAGAILAVAGVLAAAYYKDYAVVGRNHREATRLINPVSYLSATVRYARKRLRTPAVLVKLNDNSRAMPYPDAHRTVLVYVVGETARSMNFSLNGYARPTNPRLAKEDVISFPDVVSAGTATAVSLPAMFSHLPRARLDLDAATNTENLLDVLQRGGYEVVWLDNGNGGKGVDRRVESVDVSRDAAAVHRNGDSCYDEALLDGLRERIAAGRGDMLIVLHTMGSHGPSYYKRYPERFRVFTPTCDTAEIQGRPREEIVNTYDNTILYTDHVLAEVIEVLKGFPGLEAGMVYVSDHGESLGENGLYLHGFPYALAPAEQTRVPLILWLSETMRREDHIDYDRLKAAAGRLKLSHDHLFHSILGLLEVNSDLYNAKLDLFHDFRTRPLPFAPAAAGAGAP